MSLWKVEDLTTALEGKLIQAGSRPLNGVGTDTRSDLTGKIFFALWLFKFAIDEQVVAFIYYSRTFAFRCRR